ncbi:MAG: prepilin-type N-terminal cleavage/methylation domain-containing protein [Candidatus Falkowbacteria bacterium]
MTFKKQGGYTLVELIITLAILALVLVSVYGLFNQAIKISLENKLRVGAGLLADQKLEYIRNLPYDQVGTLTGIVHGNIPGNETISNTDGIFQVNTVVLYVDDPFDGTFGGMPDDTLPTDYKSIRIRISYSGSFGERHIFFATTVAPRGIETIANAGTLEIRVINASGQPVVGADVTVTNSTTVPTINFTSQTNAQGVLLLYGATPSVEGYNVLVSKAGYSQSSTSPRTVANPNPTLPNQTVIIDDKTSLTLSIDLLSNLTIQAIAQNLPNNWKINTDSGTDNQLMPRITADEHGNMYIVWQDFRSGSNGKIYMQKYDENSHAEWGSDIAIGTANNQIYPDIILDNNHHLFAAWNDNSSGNQDCYLVKRSTADGSDAWSGTKKIFTAADNKDQSKPRIALLPDGSLLGYVWQDDRNDDLDIYLQKINTNDHTEQWSPEVRVSDTTINDGTNQINPVVATNDANNFLVFWQDDRGGNQNIYGQIFDSNGTKLWTNDVLINSDGGTTNQYSPSVAVASGTVYIAWTDERNGNQDIYAQKIDMSGTKLWLNDIRANINTGASAQYGPSIIYNEDKNKPYVVWQDDRSGNFDIYGSDLSPYSTTTNLMDVPITLSGAKRIGENPVILKFKKNYTTDINGFVTITGIEWDSYDLTIGTTYVLHNLVMTNPTLPINLNPNTNQIVILNFN